MGRGGTRSSTPSPSTSIERIRIHSHSTETLYIVKIEVISVQIMRVHALALLLLSATAYGAECPPPGFDSVSPDAFDLDAYISKPWYIQEQIPVAYQTVDQLYCVRAAYQKLEDDLVQVYNYGNQVRYRGSYSYGS